MLDFVKFAQRYRVPTLTSGNSHCRSGWIQIQCPQCGSGGTHGGWYLGFSLESGAFSCYRCGKLKFWDVLTGLTRLGQHDLRKAVGECQTGTRPKPRQTVARQRTLARLSDCGPLQPPHEAYLSGRGFDARQLVENYGIEGTGHLGGVWSWRIIIPVRSAAGRVVAWQGRTIGDATPKYKMSDDDDCLEDPDGFLYGIDRAKGDSVIVVEGVPGVWRLGAGAVATFGIDWKREQLNQLRWFKNRFVIFDPEPKAQARAEQLATELSMFPGNTEVVCGFTVDPGDFPPAFIQTLRAHLGIK